VAPAGARRQETRTAPDPHSQNAGGGGALAHDHGQRPPDLPRAGEARIERRADGERERIGDGAGVASRVLHAGLRDAPAHRETAAAARLRSRDPLRAAVQQDPRAFQGRGEAPVEARKRSVAADVRA
jgi:hypothetical protein